MRRIITRCLIAGLLTAFLAVCLVGGYLIFKGFDKYRSAIDEKPLSEAVNEIRSKESFTEYKDIAKTYFDAVVAVEDRRFYLHNGFDIIGTVRAVASNIISKELREGGSTITQQLAKNMYFEMDYTIERKIAELFLAANLEKNYTKEEILELYANGIYYGSGYYTIAEASQGYFGKAPSEMNFDECTLLAGVPNAPSVYSPKVNPDLAKKRQQKVVSCMKKEGMIEE